MKTILVSGASGIVGYGILKSLRAGKDYNLVGTSIYEDSVAPAFCDIFEKAPLTSSEDYISWLKSSISKHHVDMVIPGIEDDMRKWNEQRATISGTGTTVLLNNPNLVDLCSDKWEFYLKLKDSGSALIIESMIEGDFEHLKRTLGLPFLLKPRQGFGSKGIVTVKDEDDFNEHKAEFGEKLMAQKFVGSNEEEYTVSAFFDKDSNLLCHMSLKRKLSKEGFTETAEVSEIAGIVEVLEELKKFGSPVGPTNFQFRVQDGNLKLLEINPRISSSTAIRTAFGYNESQMSVDYFLNGKVPTRPIIKKGYAVRYVEEKIFYDSSDL